MASKKAKKEELFIVADHGCAPEFYSVTDAEASVRDSFDNGDYSDADVVLVAKVVRILRCKRTVEGEDV